jgi:exodeoxyribonuclease V alpha subunit
VILSHSFRFDAGGEIQALSRAVNAGEGGQVLTLLLSPAYPGATWREIPPRAKLEQALATTILPLIEEVLTSTDPAEAFRRFNRFRLLCALREGPYGTLAVNALMERALIRRYPVLHQGPWYRGRPVLVTRNDYGLRLFNGDVGLALPDPDRDGDLRVFFPAEDGSYRSFPPRRLPEHETVYAMTVHKSQGSEFDEVLLLLPNADAPDLTRELLYTGITRARKAVRIWGDASVLRIAIDRQTLRTSGLQEAIGRIIRYPR